MALLRAHALRRVFRMCARILTVARVRARLPDQAKQATGMAGQELPDQDWRLRICARQSVSTIHGAVTEAAGLVPSPG